MQSDTSGVEHDDKTCGLARLLCLRLTKAAFLHHESVEIGFHVKLTDK